MAFEGAKEVESVFRKGYWFVSTNVGDRCLARFVYLLRLRRSKCVTSVPSGDLILRKVVKVESAFRKGHRSAA